MNDEFTRRDLLKGLAAVPLVSALDHSAQALTSQARNPTPDLCIWFHGLFAFVIKQDHIAVLTPKIHGHSYLAGLWKQEQELKEGEWYRLLGVTDRARPDQMPILTGDQAPIRSRVTIVNMAESFYLIRLPFPRQIISLRYIKGEFSGADAPPPSRRIPTAQILRYRVADYANLRLDPFKPWVTQKRPPSIINFHIFSEPPNLTVPDHAVGAFDEMIQMFPDIDLKLVNGAGSCFGLDLNLPPGLDPKHQVSLAERNGGCEGKQEGSRTGNCFMVMLDARSPA
jgi:hypothetical protein